MTENPKPKSDYTPRIDDDGIPRCSLLGCQSFKGTNYCAVCEGFLSVPVERCVCEGWARERYTSRMKREQALRDEAIQLHKQNRQLQAANIELEKERDALLETWDGKMKVLIASSIEDLQKRVRGMEREQPILKVKRLPHAEGLPLPSYATDGAACVDLYAARKTFIRHGTQTLIETGICVEIPSGYRGRIVTRSSFLMSSLTIKHGTIDSDYRGELMVAVKYPISEHAEPDAQVCLARGDRIAQLEIAPVARVDVQEVEELSETARGEGENGRDWRVDLYQEQTPGWNTGKPPKDGEIIVAIWLDDGFATDCDAVYFEELCGGWVTRPPEMNESVLVEQRDPDLWMPSPGRKVR